MAYGQPSGDVVTYPDHFLGPAQMNIPTLKTLAAALALCVVSGASFAAETAPTPAPTEQATQSVSDILTVQRGLRDRLERHSGEYARFDKDAVARMERAQDKVFNMLRGVNSLDQLNPEQKTDLSNSLDEIKAILLANEGNRQVCHRERRTGSNMIELRCETMADRETHARESQRAMQDMARTMQTTNGG